MWLHKGEHTVLVPENMPDTILRCLKDGWVETADPREVLPTPEPVVEGHSPAPAPDAEPEPVRKTRR